MSGRIYTIRLLLVLLTLLGLSACATNPVTGRQDLVLMSEDDELALGRKYHASILEAYPAYDDPKLAAYVQRVGEAVAKKSHRSNLYYRFTVLDSPEVNAFALPGGYIYITRGILAYLNSEAELAAVLGHEVGHVTARHAVRRHSASTMTGLLGSVLAASTGVRGAGDMARVISTAVVRGYGREHELEADNLGAEYLARSGYDPEAMIDVVRVLKQQEVFEKELAKQEGREPHIYHGLFATHPDNDERLKTTINASRKFIEGDAPRLVNRQAYLKMIDGISFGERAQEGVLRGQDFYHAELDFALRFPDGWRVRNLSDRLEASPAGNDGLIEVTVHDLNRRITPKEFMQSRLRLGKLEAGEAISLHGMSGYTAIAPARTQYGQRKVRTIVIYHGDKAFVIAGAAKSSSKPYQYDEAILSLGRSFHRLNASERALARPLKLVVRPYQGESYAQLANRSRLNHLAESRLRLLNKHYPSGNAKPGNLIKIVE